MNNRKIEKEIEILLDKSRLTPSSRMLKLKEKFPIVSEADSRHQLWDFDSHDIRLAKIYASLQIEDKKRNPEYNPYDERNPEQKMGDAFWGLLGEIAFEQFLWESGLLYYWARRRLGYFERKEPYDFLIPLKSGKVRKLEIITTPDYAKAIHLILPESEWKLSWDYLIPCKIIDSHINEPTAEIKGTALFFGYETKQDFQGKDSLWKYRRKGEYPCIRRAGYVRPIGRGSCKPLKELVETLKKDGAILRPYKSKDEKERASHVVW